MKVKLILIRPDPQIKPSSTSAESKSLGKSFGCVKSEDIDTTKGILFYASLLNYLQNHNYCLFYADCISSNSGLIIARSIEKS